MTPPLIDAMSWRDLDSYRDHLQHLPPVGGVYLLDPPKRPGARR